MDLVELISDSQKYDQSCKFANNCDGHSIYCHSEDKNAPRKCTYRMNPENMDKCEFFAENKKL
jgi:hypothetical protein